MMTEDEHGQLKALAWRTLKAVDHVDAKAADEGLHISAEWRAWRAQVRAVIRGDRLDIPEEPPRYGDFEQSYPDIRAVYRDAYQQHWDKVTSGTLAEAAAAPVFEDHPADPAPDPRDDQIAFLLRRVAELEAALKAPVLELSNDPPEEALKEALPDEDHAALKARILAEFASLRNMLIGNIPMKPEQLERLVALEHPKYQSWLLGVTK